MKEKASIVLSAADNQDQQRFSDKKSFCVSFEIETFICSLALAFYEMKSRMISKKKKIISYPKCFYILQFDHRLRTSLSSTHKILQNDKKKLQVVPSHSF